MPDYRVELADTTQVDRLWPLIAGGLEGACRRSGGDLTADYLWSECRSGKAFLAVISHGQDIIGASVWRFEAWTSGQKLRCLALYGKDMTAWWPQHYRLLETMVKAGNATSVVWEGRKGFERLFKTARILRQLYEVDYPE